MPHFSCCNTTRLLSYWPGSSGPPPPHKEKPYYLLITLWLAYPCVTSENQDPYTDMTILPGRVPYGSATPFETMAFYRNGSLHLTSLSTLWSVNVWRKATRAAFSLSVKFNRTGLPFGSLKAGASVGCAWIPLL